jgi:hypothetical protein
MSDPRLLVPLIDIDIGFLLWQGQYVSTLQCPDEKCSNMSVSYDPFSLLSLELEYEGAPHSLSLDALLSHFCLGEKLDDHNKWFASVDATPIARPVTVYSSVPAGSVSALKVARRKCRHTNPSTCSRTRGCLLFI